MPFAEPPQVDESDWIVQNKNAGGLQAFSPHLIESSWLDFLLGTEKDLISKWIAAEPSPGDQI
jgi:hypothetical protein